MLAGADLATWLPLAAALGGGACLGFVLGLIPGIGGRTGLLLAIPFATTMDPYAAAVFLFALHSVIHTSSSIPAISLGMPLSGADAATVVDGYPLTKMGRGGEALGASLSASALGGIIGAAAFILAIPIAKPLVTSFGPPEILLLAVIGLTMLASLSTEGLLQGLVVGIIGILFAMIGVERTTADPRFTLGFSELDSGFSLPAVVCGLFVIPELLMPSGADTGASGHRAAATRLVDVLRGMRMALSYKYVIFRSSLYGIFVGLTPSVGSTVAVWIAYAFAARTVKSEIPFGQGAIAGVIAPEAANNSKEGGAMLPTLLLGIPGSSSMAIMMGALSIVGIAAGQNMLGKNIDLSYILGATVALSNILAILPFFAVVPFIVRFTAIRRDRIAPFAISMAFSAALINSPTLSTVIEVVIMGALGVLLTRMNWPRTPFVLGFVVADMLEGSFHLTEELWGWRVFSRPLFLIMLAGIVIWVVISILRRSPLRIAGPRRLTLIASCLLALAFAAVAIWSTFLPAKLAAVPLAAAVVGAALCAGIAILAATVAQTDETIAKIPNAGLTAMFLVATPFLGLPVATTGFVARMLNLKGVDWPRAILLALAFCVVQLMILSLVYDILVEREIIGRVMWLALGY